MLSIMNSTDSKLTHLHLWDTLQWMLFGHHQLQTLGIPGLGSHSPFHQCICGYRYVHWLVCLHRQHHFWYICHHNQHKEHHSLLAAHHYCCAMLLVQPVGYHHSKQCGHFQNRYDHYYQEETVDCRCVWVWCWWQSCSWGKTHLIHHPHSARIDHLQGKEHKWMNNSKHMYINNIRTIQTYSHMISYTPGQVLLQSTTTSCSVHTFFTVIIQPACPYSDTLLVLIMIYVCTTLVLIMIYCMQPAYSYSDIGPGELLQPLRPWPDQSFDSKPKSSL